MQVGTRQSETKAFLTCAAAVAQLHDLAPLPWGTVPVAGGLVAAGLGMAAFAGDLGDIYMSRAPLSNKLLAAPLILTGAILTIPESFPASAIAATAIKVPLAMSTNALLHNTVNPLGSCLSQ